MTLLPLSVFRRLHRALAYSAVNDLVARQVQVLSVETAPDDVLRVVTEVMPVNVTTKEPDVHFRAGAIAKYGILDLSYGIDAPPMSIDRPGVGVLRDLGLVDDPGDVDGSFSSLDFLRDLATEAEEGKYYLKVFLRSKEPLPSQEAMRRLREGLPQGFWPHPFVVRDACITNASSTWLAKHFYL